MLTPATANILYPPGGGVLLGGFCVGDLCLIMNLLLTFTFNQHTIQSQQGRTPCEFTGQEVERMDCMTQAELVVWLATLAELIESKASTGAEAAEIIREKIEQLKK